jgi:hypothetical protein
MICLTVGTNTVCTLRGRAWLSIAAAVTTPINDTDWNGKNGAGVLLTTVAAGWLAQPAGTNPSAQAVMRLAMWFRCLFSNGCIIFTVFATGYNSCPEYSDVSLDWPRSQSSYWLSKLKTCGYK